MKILLRILALFLIMPVVELALLVKVAEIINFWPTIGIILVTGVVGSFLAKREGLSVWNRLQERMRQGGLPGKELMDGVIILIAGALLITPGVITDFVGFFGLIPFTRGLIRKWTLKYFKRKIERGEIQASFGVFGAGGWDAADMQHPHEGPHGPQNDTDDESWQGEGAEIPGHAQRYTPPQQQNRPSDPDEQIDNK